MTDTTTQRLVPLRCFQCGMPVNHKQVNFDNHLLTGMETKTVFDALAVVRMCCRVVLSTPPCDTRLRRRFAPAKGFAHVQHIPRVGKVYTLKTDGSMDPVEDRAPTPATTGSFDTLPVAP